MTTPAGSTGGEPVEPFAPFVPRRGRLVAGTMAVLAIVLFGFIAFLLPGPHAGGTWQVGDRVFFALIGVAIAGLLWRYASIRAVPDRQGLTVRNLMSTRTIAWQAILSVNFSGGDPWVTLDLDDTDNVAVMAIQKADGPRARADVGRLAALVEGLGTARGAPPGS